MTNWPVGFQANFHSLEFRPGLLAWRFGPIVSVLQVLNIVTNWPAGVQTNFPFVGVSARITSSALRSNSSYIVTNWPVGVQAKFPFVGVSAWITSLVLRSNSFCLAGFPHFDELAGWHPGDSSLYRRFGQDYHFGAEVQ